MPLFRIRQRDIGMQETDQLWVSALDGKHRSRAEIGRAGRRPERRCLPEVARFGGRSLKNAGPAGQSTSISPPRPLFAKAINFDPKRTLGMPIGRFERAYNRIQVIEMIDTGREAAIYGLKIFCRNGRLLLIETRISQPSSIGHRPATTQYVRNACPALERDFVWSVPIPAIGRAPCARSSPA